MVPVISLNGYLSEDITETHTVGYSILTPLRNIRLNYVVKTRQSWNFTLQ